MSPVRQINLHALCYFVALVPVLFTASVSHQKDTSSSPPHDNLTLYEDIKSGYRFQFPSVFKQSRFNGLYYGDTELHNPNTGDSIYVYSSFVPWDPQAFLASAATLHASVHHEVINGRKWVSLTAQGMRAYYVYEKGEAVLLQVSSPSPDHAVSPEDLQAMKQITTTFAFTDPSLTTHSKIAAVKAGDKFGGLVVNRVTLGAIGKGNRRIGNWPAVFDEIDFTGKLIIAGTPANDATMNSGPRWTIYIDPPNISQLPQVGYPYGIDQCQIDLKNDEFAQQQLQIHFQEADRVTAVIDHVSQYFPGGHVPPTFSANLVRIKD